LIAYDPFDDLLIAYDPFDDEHGFRFAPLARHRR
jgi:hypothetical protein